MLPRIVLNWPVFKQERPFWLSCHWGNNWVPIVWKCLEQHKAVGFVHTHIPSSQPGAGTSFSLGGSKNNFLLPERNPAYVLPKACMRDPQQEIIKSSFPATQSPPHFLKAPEEKQTFQTISEQCHVWRKTNHANERNLFFFLKAESHLCFCFCLMLILTLTLRHLERRTLLLILNFRTYCGSVKTKRLPFLKTDTM